VYRWPQEALLSPSSSLGGTSGTDSVCGGNGFCSLEGNGTDELCMKCSSCASLSICGSLSYGCLRQCATGFQDDDDDGAVASYSLASCALLAQIGAVPTFCGRKSDSLPRDSAELLQLSVEAAIKLIQPWLCPLSCVSKKTNAQSPGPHPPLGFSYSRSVNRFRSSDH